MNKLDLRMQFKSETGEHPVWTEKYRHLYRTDTYNGNPKTIYRKWLEEKLGISNWDLRLEYQRNFGGTILNNTYYCVEYSQWLEEKLSQKINKEIENKQNLIDSIEQGVIEQIPDLLNLIVLKDKSNLIEIPYLSMGKVDTSEEIPRLNLSLKKMPVKLNKCSISAAIPYDTDIEIHNKHGIDINLHVIAALKNEIACNLIKTFINKIKNEGFKTSLDSWTSWDNVKKFVVTKIFAKRYLKKIRVKNDLDLLNLLYKESNKIAKDSRLGPGNFIIISSGLASRLQESKYFKSSDTIKQLNNVFFKIGDFSSLEIYVDSNIQWNDNTIIIGRKPDTNDTGIKTLFKIDDYSTLVEQETYLNSKKVRASYNIFCDLIEEKERNLYRTINVKFKK